MKNKSVKGILWLFISKFFPPVINFSVFTYSARILLPEDFGLVALALSIIYIMSSFLPSGWREAIIKYQVNDKKTISSIFWFNFIIGLFLSFIIVFFSQLSIFEFQSTLFNSALMIFSIKLIFDGLFATLNIILLKDHKYSILAIRTIFSACISAIVIVSLLYFDFGIWALIWAQVILSLFNFLAVFIPTRQQICFSFSISELIKIKEFSMYSTLTNGLTAGLNHYESLAIGGMLGNRELGFFSVAKRLATIINEICIGTVSEISLPILAKQQDDLAKFRGAFLNSVYFSVVLLYPMFFFCLIAGEEIFQLLFTEKWLESVIIFQAFCLMFMIVVLGVPQKNIILLTNNAKWWFKLQLKLSIVIVPITTISVYWGIYALLLALILGKATYCGCSMWRSCSLLSINVKDYIISFINPLLASLGSAMLTFFLKDYFYIFGSLIFRLLVIWICFVVVYLVALLLLDSKKLIVNYLVIYPKSNFFLKLAQKYKL